MQNDIYLALGSNKGNRLDFINKAFEELENHNIKITLKSSIYETEPYGVENQDKFLNVVIKVSADLTPTDMLITLKNIEKKLGRTKTYHWGPREIDIDILYYNQLILSQTISDELSLIIPHQDLQNRLFVLEPLNEIAPDFIHPILQKTTKELLDNLFLNS